MYYILEMTSQFIAMSHLTMSLARKIKCIPTNTTKLFYSTHTIIIGVLPPPFRGGRDSALEVYTHQYIGANNRKHMTLQRASVFDNLFEMKHCCDVRRHIQYVVHSNSMIKQHCLKTYYVT